MGNSIIKRPTEQIDNQEIEKRSNIASSISFSETFLKHQNSNNEEEESADNQQVITFVIHTNIDTYCVMYESVV